MDLKKKQEFYERIKANTKEAYTNPEKIQERIAKRDEFYEQTLKQEHKNIKKYIGAIGINL